MTSAEDARSIDPPTPQRAMSASAEGAAPAGLVVVVFDAETGAVVGIEGRDAEGRRQGSPPPVETTASEPPVTLDDVLQQAFEAGIACILGADGEADEPATESEDELRGLLLGELINHSRVRRLMRRDVLQKAVLTTLLSEAAAAAPNDGNSAN